MSAKLKVSIAKQDGKRKVNQWNLVKEPQKDKRTGTTKIIFAIKRWVVDSEGKGHTERYPRSKYSGIAENWPELEKLVRRLNEREFGDDLDKRENILNRLAFISAKDVEDYERYLATQIPSAEGIKKEITTLKTYVINFFVGELNISNPKKWYRDGRQQFAEYVLGDKVPQSAYGKKFIVQVANRFMRWLHDLRPEEMPQVLFPQPGRAMLLKIERRRVSTEVKRRRTYIPDDDWSEIETALKTEKWKHLYPWAMLCYRYGLRRAEAFGLLYEGTDAIFDDILCLKRQMIAWNEADGPTFDLLKTPGRMALDGTPVEQREIPHWLDIDPYETGELIELGSKNLMHPDTFSHGWAEMIEELVKAKKIAVAYTVHEIRHTWITKCRRKQDAREVQIAAGHKSMDTTNKYTHDDSKFNRKKLFPKKRA